MTAAASEALGGAPEELVVRSAEARAAAQGVSVDEILQAWAGGEAPAPAAPAAPTEASPPAEAAAPEPEAAEVEARAEPVPTEEVTPAEAAPAAAAVAVLEEEEPFEPAPLGQRVRFAAMAGGVIGLLFGMVLSLGASPLLLDRATVLGEEPFVAGVEVTLTRLLIVTAIVSAGFGAFIAVVSRVVPGWFHREMSLRGRPQSAAWLGALLGAVVGAVAAPLTAGLVGETIETGVVLSIRGAVVTVLIGGAVLGALVASAVQLVGEPSSLPSALEEESTAVRRRLAGGILIPLAALAAIAVLVLPFALLLLEFHSAAPLLAIVAAAGILTFAFLAAYKPGMRITTGEFILAAVGIGLVLLFIVLAYLAWGGSDGHAEETEAALRWLAA